MTKDQENQEEKKKLPLARRQRQPQQPRRSDSARKTSKSSPSVLQAAGRLALSEEVGSVVQMGLNQKSWIVTECMTFRR